MRRGLARPVVTYAMVIRPYSEVLPTKGDARIGAHGVV